MIGGLLAVAMTQIFNASWQLKLSTILIPAAIYLVMALTMAVSARPSACSRTSPPATCGRRSARPLFILLFICMWMTAAAELGPDQWFPSVMGALVPQMQGVLFLVYTAGLMFLLRTFGSGIAHKNPIGTLFVCSILTAVGLYWLGGLQPGTSALMAFAASTVFAVGKSYFWPTMIGVTAEQFPRGGALLISIMGGTGMLSVAVALPKMGAKIDAMGGGAAGGGAALRMVAVLGVILAVIFGALYAWFKARGGYRAVDIAKSRYCVRLAFRKSTDRASSSRPFIPSSTEIHPANPAAARRLKMAS